MPSIPLIPWIPSHIELSRNEYEPNANSCDLPLSFSWEGQGGDSLCGGYWCMHPETPAAEADDGHADVGGHIAESQCLLLLKEPDFAFHHLPWHLEVTAYRPIIA